MNDKIIEEVMTALNRLYSNNYGQTEIKYDDYLKISKFVSDNCPTLSQPDVAEMMAEALQNAQATLKYHGITPLIKVEQAITAYEQMKKKSRWMPNEVLEEIQEMITAIENGETEKPVSANYGSWTFSKLWAHNMKQTLKNNGVKND